MSELRAKITSVTFHVVYPDGSTKDSKFEPTDRIDAILMSEAYMTEDMKKKFTVSRTDWKKNPAMIIMDGKIMKPNCEFPDCQNA